METNKSNNIRNSDFIDESKENIMEGARVFSEKASDLFNSFLEKVRVTAEAAYEKGSEIIESVTLTAQDYVDKYRDRVEISQLKKQRDEVATQLGNMCFMEFSGRYRFRVEFMKGDEFRNLIAQMRELDREIIRIGEKLENEK
jgi:hypothetical protein